MELPAPLRSPAVGLHAGCLGAPFYRRLTDKWAKEPLHWRRRRVKSAISGPVCRPARPPVCQPARLSVCQRVTRSLAFAALLFTPPSLVSLTGANVSVPLKSVYSSEFDERVYFFTPLRKTKGVLRLRERLEKREMDVSGCSGKSTARLPKLLVSVRGTRPDI